MNWVKGFVLVTCLAMPLSTIVATTVSADPAADAAKTDATKTGATKTDATKTPPAKSDSMMKSDTKKPAMSDADKMAKAADCSKQADAKGLHGEARKKFRSQCKHG